MDMAMAKEGYDPKHAARASGHALPAGQAQRSVDFDECRPIVPWKWQVK
jgi:hypothetical protein